MGIQGTFKAAAQTIISAFGDVPVATAIYHSKGTTGYTPATGAVAETGGSDVTLTRKLIWSEYRVDEIDGVKIKLNDKKALIAVEDLSVTPKVEDYITVSTVVWNVIDFNTDPAEALWIIQCRKA